MVVPTSADRLAAEETWSQAPEQRGGFSPGTQVRFQLQAACCTQRAGELGSSSDFLVDLFFCFSLLSLFLKQFSFPSRDLLIIILWTNQSSCKTLKATQSVPLLLPCSLSRFPCRWKQFLAAASCQSKN